MNRVYVAGGGETLETVGLTYYGKASDAELDLLRAANPRLVQCGPLRPNQLIFVPESAADLASDPYRLKVEAAWSVLTEPQKRVVTGTLRNNDGGFWEALLELLTRYEVVNKFGYVNTFGAGAMAGPLARATKLYRTLQDVDGLLREYARARPIDRHALKPRIRLAYEKMNRSFRGDLRLASARLKSSGRLGPLRSSRQGMQRAVINAKRGSRSVLGSTAEAVRVMKLAKYGKVVGRGMLVLDLGVRAHNVAQSSNRLRTAISEGTGLAASFGVGMVVYGKCVSVAAAFTGPWSMAICLLPAGSATLLADEGGKLLGSFAYDAISK